MSTRPEQDGEVFFLSIPFHPLCYSNVTPSWGNFGRNVKKPGRRPGVLTVLPHRWLFMRKTGWAGFSASLRVLVRHRHSAVRVGLDARVEARAHHHAHHF